jgi:LDH2 family malate/lactate/ureidoglycolate dehydrogenase
VLAIDVGRFRKFEEFGRDVEELVGVLKTLPRAEGFDQILMPGEQSQRRRAEAMRVGIPFKTTCGTSFVDSNESQMDTSQRERRAGDVYD